MAFDPKLTEAQKNALLNQLQDKLDQVNGVQQTDQEQQKNEASNVVNGVGYEATRSRNAPNQGESQSQSDPPGGKKLNNGDAAYLARNIANQLGVLAERASGRRCLPARRRDFCPDVC